MNSGSIGGKVTIHLPRYVALALAIFVSISMLVGWLGLDPLPIFAAMIFGGLGHAIGEAIKLVVAIPASRIFRLEKILTGFGVLLGLFSEKAIPLGLEHIVDPSVPFMALTGGIVGAFAGLIPWQLVRELDEEFSVASFWTCCGCGVVGGLPASLFSALVFTYVGYKVFVDRSDQLPRRRNRGVWSMITALFGYTVVIGIAPVAVTILGGQRNADELPTSWLIFFALGAPIAMALLLTSLRFGFPTVAFREEYVVWGAIGSVLALVGIGTLVAVYTVGMFLGGGLGL